MNKNYDDNIRLLICEILLFTLILLVTIPICVNASNNYNEKKDKLVNCNNIHIDIKNGDGNKLVRINNYNDKMIVSDIVFKISKHNNKYKLFFDDDEYNLWDMIYSEDNEYNYYNLGNYSIKDSRDINFKLVLVDGSEEDISYSFMVEELIC